MFRGCDAGKLPSKEDGFLRFNLRIGEGENIPLPLKYYFVMLFHCIHFKG